MYHSQNVRTRSILVAMAVVVLASAPCAFAQWPQQQQDTSGFALSYAYQGSTNGFRLEMSRGDYLIDVGWFDDSDGDVYCLELGMDPTGLIGGYDAIPFMLGVGGYQLSASDPAVDDSTNFNFWAGIGDFDHSSTGLFFQYRYIFGGPLSGSQGIVGWAF